MSRRRPRLAPLALAIAFPLSLPAVAASAEAVAAEAERDKATTLDHIVVQGASDGYKAATEKLNAQARYMGEAEFKAMFEADSVANAEAVKKAGLAKKN